MASFIVVVIIIIIIIIIAIVIVIVVVSVAVVISSYRFIVVVIVAIVIVVIIIVVVIIVVGVALAKSPLWSWAAFARIASSPSAGRLRDGRILDGPKTPPWGSMAGPDRFGQFFNKRYIRKSFKFRRPPELSFWPPPGGCLSRSPDARFCHTSAVVLTKISSHAILHIFINRVAESAFS